VVRTASRLHLNSAHVISVIALFVALGGTTWAAIQLPKGSVGTKQLKAEALVSTKGQSRLTGFH
jgi:hypothetical protein